MPCPHTHDPGLSWLSPMWSCRRFREPMSQERGAQERPEVSGGRRTGRGRLPGQPGEERREAPGSLFLQAKERVGSPGGASNPAGPRGWGSPGGFSGSSCPAAP
ncbi:unnamed protein product [Coccothraustes coccothraustes]